MHRDVQRDFHRDAGSDWQALPRQLMNGLWIAVFSLLIALAWALPGAAARADDLDGIRTAVFDYFDGINEVSRERLERAFDPSAELKSVGESGQIKAIPIADTIERWMTKTPAKRAGKILSMDVTDDEIARVVFDYNGEYVDFLTLAKLNDRWKIIDKVFIKK